MMMVRPLSACCFSVLLAMAGGQFSPLRAQGQKYEGMMVRNIQFVPDKQTLDASELHHLLPLKIAQPLRMADVRASIEKLFATGTYADIQVEAQPYRDGVAVVFHTENSWFVGDVTVSGHISSPPNAGQLENAGALNLGQPYREAALQQGVAGQKRAMESNGLYQAKVHPVFDWETGREHQQVNIRFEINSGPRAHFTTPVLTGDLKMDTGKIVTATKFQRWFIHSWKPVTQTRVRQAIDGVRLLYQRENRLEAKVSLDSMRYDPATNHAMPTLRIDAGPHIEVRTIGVNLSQRRLRRYVPVFEEHAVDHDLLIEGARNLRDYLQSAGYFDAEVEFKEQRVVNDKAAIDYLVNPGSRHKLVAIEIAGNHYFRTEAIRERMFLQVARFLQFPHGRYSGNLLSRDEDSIRNLYQSNGFRDVEVAHRLEDDYNGIIGSIAVFIDIKEGPQYFIDSLQVDGLDHLNKEEVLARLSSVAGQPFSEFNVAVDRDAILARYNEKGFPNATFEWNSTPASVPHRVDLRFVIHEGEQQFVRQVLVTGNKVTKDQLIFRNLRLNPGDPLSPTAITETQRRLVRSRGVREGGCGHPGPGWRDRRKVCALQSGRSAALLAGYRVRR